MHVNLIYVPILDCLNKHKQDSRIAKREMQNQDELPMDAEIESLKASEVDDWENIKDNDIMQQQSAIWAEEAKKFPFVGDKARANHYTLMLKPLCRSPLFRFLLVF